MTSPLRKKEFAADRRLGSIRLARRSHRLARWKRLANWPRLRLPVWARRYASGLRKAVVAGGLDERQRRLNVIRLDLIGRSCRRRDRRLSDRGRGSYRHRLATASGKAKDEDHHACQQQPQVQLLPAWRLTVPPPGQRVLPSRISVVPFYLVPLPLHRREGWLLNDGRRRRHARHTGRRIEWHEGAKRQRSLAR